MVFLSLSLQIFFMVEREEKRCTVCFDKQDNSPHHLLLLLFPFFFFFFFFHSLYHLIFFITIQIKNQLQNKIFLNHINHILLLLKKMFTKPGLTFNLVSSAQLISIIPNELCISHFLLEYLKNIIKKLFHPIFVKKCKIDGLANVNS